MIKWVVLLIARWSLMLSDESDLIWLKLSQNDSKWYGKYFRLASIMYTFLASEISQSWVPIGSFFCWQNSTQYIKWTPQFQKRLFASSSRLMMDDDLRNPGVTIKCPFYTFMPAQTPCKLCHVHSCLPGVLQDCNIMTAEQDIESI
jgi:hypothetical protein